MTAARSREITDEHVVVDDPDLGRVLYILPVIPEDAPYRIREGIARRRIATLTGECPCGGTRGPRPKAQPGTVMVSEFAHEPRCPAITETLVKAIRRWTR